jgi:multiple sugar transport system ATP-binding protein
MARVEIRDVRKSYDDVPALHGVSIDIADGEFVTLVGPSGCGKSTLLKMVAGLEEITEGEIAVDGRLINDVPAKERDVAMVFQSYALYPHMTAAENMGFALRMQRRPPAEIARRVEETAAVLGIGELLHRRPRQLSGGQRQRVAIGRAIVRNPKVFLFDEPLSNLDATLRVQMRTEIKQLHRRLGATMVFVTHDQVEAMTMADRIVVMNDGRVEQEGTPLELYDRPVNRFVAGFIGSPAMNFFAGRIRVESTPRFVSDGGITFPLLNAPAAADGRSVVCGIRPEHFELGSGTVDAEVLEVEPTGSETQVLARVSRHEVVGLFRERISVAPGETIRFAPVFAHIHVFDAETGLRIA